MVSDNMQIAAILEIKVTLEGETVKIMEQREVDFEVMKCFSKQIIRHTRTQQLNIITHIRWIF